ncbi:hypothetical protein PISL3812_04365 [Talaromyces islandicus]|uniref:Uncharacterized protein n=1 Tax=Talaromyces islandicus TaxID=28573 RepID=A0A0U1LVC2_TALIS|nr:hypothetical protein PISL3812_04365 [Talaromyces islandicus]
MDSRSDYTATHQNGSRLSTSLPQSASSGPAPSPGSSVSHRPQPRREDSRLDESTLARRTTALRQLHGNPKPLSRRPRDNKPITGRSSTLASQPVLVRSYSPDADASRSSTNMRSDSQSRRCEMPSVDEFNIEAILQAIEPDIRSTLDSIAEICGRSKLSLANEYGSHIAPFGEMHPPLGGLVTVEEASVSSERLANSEDNNIVIVDDDHDNYGSTMGLLDNLRTTAFATGYRQLAQRPNEDLVNREQSHVQDIVAGEGSPTEVPVVRMEASSETSKPVGKALLASTSGSSTTAKQSTITSPAMLSETLLDAQGNRSSWPSVPPDTPQGSPTLRTTSFSTNRQGCFQNQLVDRKSFVREVQGWLDWLKTIAQRERYNQQSFEPQTRSAEITLRAVLARDQDQAIAVPSA